MRILLIVTCIFLGVACLPSAGVSAVTVENVSDQTVSVYLAGPRDEKYIGPYVIRRKCTNELPIAAGRYRILARVPASGCRREILQYRRSSADGSIRNGAAKLRGSGTRR